MVRGLHFKFTVRGVGGIRRQPRTGTGGRRFGGASVGGVYEARGGVARVRGYASIRGAGGNCNGGDRSGFTGIGDAELSGNAAGSIHRRNAADGVLPSSWWRDER